MYKFTLLIIALIIIAFLVVCALYISRPHAGLHDRPVRRLRRR